MTSNYSIERGTDAVAVSAVTSPFWLPVLQQWSELAALILPIAGLIWLIVQIIGYFTRHKDKK